MQACCFPPIPPWNSSCKANTGLSAVRGLQIFVVLFVFYEQSRHSSWQHLLTASRCLLLMLLMPGCQYHDTCGGSIHMPSLSLSGGP